jgi:hypothetical protein
MPPEYAEVLVLTFILELPQDLRHPQDKAFGLTEERDDVFVDWPDEAKTIVTRVPITTPGRSPVCRLVFRNAEVKMPLPLQAADFAFGEWTRPFFNDEAWEERNRILEEAVSSGMDVRRTVVAATRFTHPDLWGQTPDERLALLGHEFQESLDFLNDYIITLSMVRGDPSLTPVARGDLAASCPVIVDAVPMQEGLRRGTTFIYPIHEQLPDFVYEVEDIDEAAGEQLEELFGLRRYDGFPMLLYYEFLHSAEASRRLHRYVPAISSLGTAIEVLFSAVIRMIGSGAEHDDAAVEAALRAPLRNQVEHHLPQYVNVDVDVQDANNPFGRWWLGGYKLRNRVLHEGHRPTEPEVDSAFDDAGALLRAIAAGMETEEREGPGFRVLWPFSQPEDLAPEAGSATN